jgi:WD40 repeat protein
LEGGHDKTVRNISWHPDGNHLASCGFDGNTCIWMLDVNNDSYQLIQKLTGPHCEAKSASFNRNG